MAENVLAKEVNESKPIIFRFDENIPPSHAGEVWRPIRSRFGVDEGEDVSSFDNIIKGSAISLQREVRSNPRTGTAEPVWILVAQEIKEASDDTDNATAVDITTFELNEQVAEYVHSIAAANNSEAVSLREAQDLQRVVNSLTKYFPMTYTTPNVTLDLVHVFGGEEAPDVSWVHESAARIKNPSVDKRNFFYDVLGIVFVYCACVRIAAKSAAELRPPLEVLWKETEQKSNIATRRNLLMSYGLVVVEVCVICAVLLSQGSGFSLSSPLMGSAYWRSCSNSTTDLGYGGQASLEVTHYSEIPAYMYFSFSRVALATQYRFPQTVSAIRALDSVSGPYASPWRTVPTFCVDLYTALRNASGAVPSAALTLASCAGLLAAEFPDVALHNNVSSFTWEWVKSIPALVLSFDEKLNTRGFSMSSNTSNAAFFDLSSYGTLTTTFQLPTSGCIANALTFRGTRCALYNDESATSTPYLFVVLSVLRVVCFTLLVNLVLFPFVLNPLKRCLSCLVDVPLIGDIVSDIDVPLTIINFQQVFPDCLKPHDSMEDRMNTRPESFYRLSNEAETVMEATEEILKVGGHFVDELVDRFGPLGCVKGRQIAADGADEKDPTKDEDPIVDSKARPAHFDMRRETAEAVVVGLLGTKARVQPNSSKSVLSTIAMKARAMFQVNYLDRKFPELARAPPLFAYTEINAILERLDIPLEALRRLTAAISSDLWFMVTAYDEYCHRAIFSEPMVLLYAYLHQSYHERFALSKGEPVEDPREDSNDAVDEFSVEVKEQQTAAQSPPPRSSQRIMARLREVCPTLDTNDWYSYGDEAWTLERKEGPWATTAMMSVEEYIHKMYKDYPQIPGVVTRRQQMAYHGVQRATPGTLLIFISLVSTLGVALLDLVQGHNKQLTPVDSPLIPAAFRFVNTGSLVTMHVNRWLINRIEYALSLPPGSHSNPLVVRMYFWGYGAVMLTAAVFFVPGLVIAFDGFLVVSVAFFLAAVLLAGPLVMVLQATRNAKSDSSVNRRVTSLVALLIVTFNVIFLSVGMALFVQMPFNVGYLAFFRARADGSLSSLRAGTGVDMVMNEYESRLLSCWMEDVYNSIPSSMAQRLSYFALP